MNTNENTNILEQIQPMLRAMCYIAAKEAGDANLQGANLWFSIGIKVALNIGDENRGVIIYQHENTIMASSGNGCFKGTAEQYKDALKLKYSGDALDSYIAIINALVWQLKVENERRNR